MLYIDTSSLLKLLWEEAESESTRQRIAVEQTIVLSFLAELVHRLAYNGDAAASQLAVFQGASEAPISGFIWVERATRKNSQLARGPEGCVENGPAAALLVGYVSI